MEARFQFREKCLIWGLEDVRDGYGIGEGR